MRAPLSHTPTPCDGIKKSAVVSLVALTAATLLFAGCKRPADDPHDAVSADVTKAEYELQRKPDASTAIPILNQATANKNAPAPDQSLANLLAGQADVLAADAIFREIDAQQIRLERTLGRLGALTSQVQANNVAVNGLTIKEPKATLAVLDKTTAAAKSGEQGVWLASDVAPIPALDAVEKSIADLTQQGDTLKAQHADLEKKRNDALLQAEQLSAKSEQSKGKESLDQFTQASNFRKAAADISTQLVDTDAKAGAVDRELSVAKAKQAQLQTALTAFAGENKQVSTGWQDVQKRIDEITAKSKALVDGDAAAPATGPANAPAGSISAAGDQIEQISQDLAKLRDKAKADLDRANVHFAAAVKQNKDVQGEFKKLIDNPDLRSSPQQPAWRWMVEIHNDSDPDLQRAEVEQRLARLHADQAYYANSRISADAAAAAAVKGAGLTAPKSLEGADLDEKLKAARAAAEEAFKKSEELLDATIARQGNESLKTLAQAASVAKMIEQYGHWAFGRSIGDNQADTYLRASKDLATELSNDEKLALPVPLPPEIAPPARASSTPATPVAPVAPVPAPAPAVPATAPAEAPAPATNPAAPAPTPAETPAPAPSPAPAAPSPSATPAPAAPEPAPTPAPPGSPK
ncbi:MAG TPA: hypothetical protein VG326_15630 [Tepidisphaeraceae bacterium]|jgi:hypothetical protein|nr:hypothetical protein [Tepidisphaeraceae bacterium]